jgi:acyl-CoA synthetase (AMP-forming)/AMP-acid ligase II
MTTPTVLDRFAPAAGQRLIALPGGQAHASADVIAGAHALAARLRAAPGYQPGRRVALSIGNTVEAPVALLGAWFAGLTPGWLNAAATPDDLRHCLDALSPLLLLESAAGRLAPAIADPLPRLEVPPGGPGGASPARAEVPAIDPSVDAVILFTSGSTGRPKGVRITHRGLAATVAGLAAALAPEREVFLLQGPMHHIFGVVTLLLALTTGSDAVLVPEFRADAVLEAISRHRATIGFGPPEMFLSLATCPTRDRFDLGSFRRVLLGGSPCRAPQIRTIEERLGLATVYLSFGMTETTGGVSLAPFRDPAGDARVHAGRPVPSIEVGVFADGRPVAAGAEGEICFRGPHRMAGYLGEPPLAPDAWVRSGDLGRLDASGLLHVTGRIKEIIIKAGENISIAEIERALLACGQVREVCVVGIPDERLGENIAAAVVAADPALTKRALQAHCQGRLVKSHVPQRIAFVDQLPRLATGKVDRAAVRARVAPGAR